MPDEKTRNARNTFAAQLTNMIRDFERQTGATIEAINVVRDTFRSRTGEGEKHQRLFRGVYIALDERK